MVAISIFVTRLRMVVMKQNYYGTITCIFVSTLAWTPTSYIPIIGPYLVGMMNIPFVRSMWWFMTPKIDHRPHIWMLSCMPRGFSIEPWHMHWEQCLVLERGKCISYLMCRLIIPYGGYVWQFEGLNMDNELREKCYDLRPLFNLIS